MISNNNDNSKNHHKDNGIIVINNCSNDDNDIWMASPFPSPEKEIRERESVKNKHVNG